MSNRIMSMAVAASLFAAPAALASTMTIDDFNDTQIVQDLPDTGAVKSSQVSGGMFGGYRYMEVTNADDRVAGTQLDSQIGSLSFANGPATSGTGYIVYDGFVGDRSAFSDVNGFGVNVNTTGLNENLLFGSVTDTFFSFDLSNFNPGTGGSTALFTAAAWDLDGMFATFSEIVGEDPIVDTLSLFEFAGGTDFDWTRVGALAFKIDSTSGFFDDTAFGGANFDGSIGPITINVIPLPASALLLLGGLGGFAGLSAMARRRKNA